MSVRTEIQKKVHELIAGGTFKKVTYDADHLPVESTTQLAPKSIVCNETTAGMQDGSARDACGVGFILTDWRFECTSEFTSEVDVSYFMLNELRNLNFISDEIMVTVTPGNYSVVHPPRNAAHNGTKLTIGLTVNTRR